MKTLNRWTIGKFINKLAKKVNRAHYTLPAGNGKVFVFKVKTFEDAVVVEQGLRERAIRGMHRFEVGRDPASIYLIARFIVAGRK